MHFFRSKVSQFSIVGGSLVVIFGTIVITVWLLMPEWREYRAIQAIVSAAKKSDNDGVLNGIDKIAKLTIRASTEDAILALLEHSDPNVRCYGAISAISLNLDRTRVKRALIEMLNADEDQSVRHTAAASLGALGTDAADAIPSITRELLEDPRDPRDHRAPRSTVLALLDIQFAGVELPDPTLVPQSPQMWFWVPPASQGSCKDLASRLIAHGFLGSGTRKPVAPTRTISSVPKSASPAGSLPSSVSQ